MPSRETNGKEATKTGSRDFITGAIIGAVAGAAAALLFTPRSGKELRTSINEQTVSILEKTDEVKEKAVSKSSELATAAKEKASSLAQTVSDQSADLMNKVKQKNESDPQAEENLDTSQSYSSEEIQEKLAETQKAFDETEQKLNQ